MKLIRLLRHGDHRGYFAEVWNRERFAQVGLAFDWVQDNESLSAETRTLRGLHFQRPPAAQTKLVRVLQGAVLDVAVDLRQGSPWHGQHVLVELTARGGEQLLVPKGFAHGFLTLEPATLVAYKVDAPYSAAHDAGVAWDDPELGIPWPTGDVAPTLSEKDRRQPALRDLPSCFT